ncbi:hypothetical protein JHK87_010532 [Glycine soja]|nr:hypothetical protein JHK87_010532 [Glycine soja]
MLNSIEIEKKATKSMPPITFMDEDFRDIDRCHNDPMVVKIPTTIFKDKKGSKSIMIKYLTVSVRTSYNALIGRPSLNELGVIISTPHLTMKFPSKNGRIIVVWADQITTRECYATSLRVGKEKKGIKPKA